MAPTLSVAHYYSGKTIFITGGTGFIGKVLIEKILYTCPDVEKIYLLMRSKKGLSSKQRLEEFVKNKAFQRINTECPSKFKKLHLISGDILEEDLGISKEDRAKLERECHIVFHSAACVRFDLPLREAVNLNVVGTKRVLELAENMEKLEVFLHISTAFSFAEEEVLEEKIYRSRHRPQDVMNCVKWMDDELLATVERKIIPPQPNTYGYTKGLSEDLVAQYEGKFPIVLARPSIVVGAYKEPIPGWIDNLNGPTGIIVAAGKGVLRTMLCDPDVVAEVIPVDVVVNACIILSYLTAIKKPKQIEVCNITNSDENPITWGEAINICLKNFKNVPFSQCLWLPHGTPQTSVIIHKISVLLFHLLPAYLIDLLCIILQKKPFLVNVQKKIAYGQQVLEDYTIQKWTFKNQNFCSLRNKISPKDNEVYYTDVTGIDWESYAPLYIKAARQYICNEDPSTLPQARKMYMRLYYIDRATKLLFYVAFAYFLYYLYNLLISFYFY